LDVLQAIAQDFSTQIIVKTMAFGSDADVTKLKKLATLGGGEFSAAVRLSRFIFNVRILMTMRS
jgi:hypothetical protein